MAKNSVRRRPPHTLTKERQSELEASATARAESIKNDNENGNVSRSSENPDVGRPTKSKESATKKGATDNVS